MSFKVPEGAEVGPANCEFRCPKINAGVDASGGEGAVCMEDGSLIASANRDCLHGFSFVYDTQGKLIGLLSPSGYTPR